MNRRTRMYEGSEDNSERQPKRLNHSDAEFENLYDFEETRLQVSAPWEEATNVSRAKHEMKQDNDSGSVEMHKAIKPVPFVLGMDMVEDTFWEGSTDGRTADSNKVKEEVIYVLNEPPKWPQPSYSSAESSEGGIPEPFEEIPQGQADDPYQDWFTLPPIQPQYDGLPHRHASDMSMSFGSPYGNSRAADDQHIDSYEDWHKLPPLQSLYGNSWVVDTQHNNPYEDWNKLPPLQSQSDGLPYDFSYLMDTSSEFPYGHIDQWCKLPPLQPQYDGLPSYQTIIGFECEEYQDPQPQNEEQVYTSVLRMGIGRLGGGVPEAAAALYQTATSNQPEHRMNINFLCGGEETQVQPIRQPNPCPILPYGRWARISEEQLSPVMTTRGKYSANQESPHMLYG